MRIFLRHEKGGPDSGTLSGVPAGMDNNAIGFSPTLDNDDAQDRVEVARSEVYDLPFMDLTSLQGQHRNGEPSS